MIAAGNASPLELTWTAIAVLGVVVAAALVAHVGTSYRTVIEWIALGRIYRDGPRHRFVSGFLTGVSLLLLVWLGFVALGGNAISNPPPLDAERQAASERGGWILVSLELALLVFTLLLAWAWVSVGKPTLHPNAPSSPAALLFQAIDLGRQLGHDLRSDAQLPIAVLDDIARDPSVPAELRVRAGEALVAISQMLRRVREVHNAIKALEGTP